MPGQETDRTKDESWNQRWVLEEHSFMNCAMRLHYWVGCIPGIILSFCNPFTTWGSIIGVPQNDWWSRRYIIIPKSNTMGCFGKEVMVAMQDFYCEWFDIQLKLSHLLRKSLLMMGELQGKRSRSSHPQPWIWRGKRQRGKMRCAGLSSFSCSRERKTGC